MATPSSILAWEISWAEEPGRLPSWGWKESDTTVTKPPHHSSWERVVKPHLWRKTDRWSHHLLQSREGWRLHIFYLISCERAFTSSWKESALGPLNLRGTREKGWSLTHPWKSSRPQMAALIDLYTIIVSYLRREPGPHWDCKVIREWHWVRVKRVSNVSSGDGLWIFHKCPQKGQRSP